jgi:hypothetical protein
MIPIAERSIVRLTMPATNSENAIQPVSNQGVGR